MTPRVLILCAAATALCLGHANASIITDFNSGQILADFLFDDPAGTTIPDTANSANPALTFDFDSDSAAIVTNGSGQLDASPKNNTSLGTNYVDLPTINSGRVLALFEVTWDFDESVYDPAQDEEFRLTLITNDPRSTFITAQTFFRRTSATEVTLFGDTAGTPALDTDDVLLGSEGTILTVLDANLDTDVLELYYSLDGGASFLSVGPGLINASRGVESLRLVVNEDYSDDVLLIDRVAVSWLIPEPTAACLGLIGAFLAGVRRRG